MTNRKVACDGSPLSYRNSFDAAMYLLPKLRTPSDLFRKAEADLVAFESSPGDAHLAFNLFVTIEHIPDWLDMRPEVKRKAELRIVSHIANGSKHFEVGPTKSNPERRLDHKSVEDVSLDSYADDYADDYFEERLTIHLSIDEAKFVGLDEIDGVVLAQRALDFWRPLVPGI